MLETHMNFDMAGPGLFFFLKKTKTNKQTKLPQKGRKMGQKQASFEIVEKIHLYIF